MITFEREHFNTGEPITIRVTHNKEVHEVKVQYLTDVVFEPGVYEIKTKMERVGGDGIQEEEGEKLYRYNVMMDFGFVEKESRVHNQMINNIGLIRIMGEGFERKLAMILSREKDELYLTLIAAQGK